MSDENLEFRYYPAKGLRKRNSPLGRYGGREIRSEHFDTMEEFCLAIASDILDLILEEQETNDENDVAD